MYFIHQISALFYQDEQYGKKGLLLYLNLIYFMHMDSNITKFQAFRQGARVVFTLPGLMLSGAMIGFAGFAVEVGLSRFEAVLMAGLIWALPSQLILIGSIFAGAALPAAFLAVALSAIRLMPMTAALVPEIKNPKTPTWLLLLLSHFVAVTAWVYSMEKVKHLPRDVRVSFFAGAGGCIWAFNTMVIGVSYDIVTDLPLIAIGALLFLTPVYFTMALWRSARDYSVYIAMIFGFILGPLFNLVFPEIDILLAGVVGGSFATAIYLLNERKNGERS